MAICGICGLRKIPQRTGKGHQLATCGDPECRKKYHNQSCVRRRLEIKAGGRPAPLPAVPDEELAERIRLAKSLKLAHFELRYLGEDWLGGYKWDIQLGGGLVEPVSVHIQTKEQALEYVAELEQVVQRLREWGSDGK